MKRTEWLQESRKMRLEEAYAGYRGGKRKRPYHAFVGYAADISAPHEPRGMTRAG